MSMTQDEATRLKMQIEQEHPELTSEVRQYEGVWTILVQNPRTGEHIGIVSANDWHERISMIEGGITPADSHPVHSWRDMDQELDHEREA